MTRNTEGVKSQSLDAVKVLLTWKKRPSDPLPNFIEMDGLRLVLSSKKDAYYVTTARECSCKAGQFGKMCKHRKALLEDPRSRKPGKYKPVPEEVCEDAILAGYDGPCRA